MKKVIAYFCLLFALSCARLDNNLYNANNKIKEYKLDDYTGEQDFFLDASYNIPKPLINMLDISSEATGSIGSAKIKAVYIGDIGKIRTDTVILYCHGNKWHIDFYWQRSKLLAHVNGKNRYGVMVFDYRGYGLSEGKTSEEALYADTDACMKWLKENGLTGNRLMIYGFSMGTAPSVELCAKPRTLTPSKIILEAPFASADVMVQDGSQLSMPASYATNLKIDNAEEIKRVAQPFLWLHGLNDNFLNYKTHGEVVFKNYKGNYKEKFLVADADHGEIPTKAGFEKYLEAIGAFMRRP